MIKLINARSGGDMWVHESKLEKYLAAGHKLAVPPTPAAPAAPAAQAKKPPAKKTTAKPRTTGTKPAKPAGKE